MANKTVQQQISYRRYYRAYNPSDGSSSGGSSTQETKWTDSFIGGENPNYREQIKRGANATTNASGRRQVIIPATIQGEIVRRGVNSSTLDRTYTVGGSIASSSWNWDGVVFNYTKADTAARIMFINKWRQTRQAFSSGTFLGELVETLRMIKRPATSLRRGLDAYYGAVKERTRRIKSEKLKSKVAAGTWLEYQYGWRPLVNDIDDAMKALAGLRRVRGIPITGWAADESIGGHSFTNISCSPYHTFDYRLRVKSTVLVRYKGLVRAEMDTPPDWKENWGIRTQDFVPTIWELIPYSFLVDYFTNIGDVLTAASEGICRLSWGCKTSRGEINARMLGATLRIPQNTSQLLYSGSGSLSGFSAKYSSFSRQRIDAVSVGFSDFRLSLPEFGSKKWLNMAALAAMRR